ncbi:hypothetical protein NRB_16460 [Novosphingobium sp. 11B]|uniref:Uncharacterized protein n=1 Tax=Novosphingobium resinovorum TaxID=158500 RepID=A0A031K728_9SPHN|nr:MULTISPECIES: hypothetical protein [Sphingomonadaceae]EJU10314.1 hypothetical protein LH128_24157 [Sphingomonas sp. LH128]EZP84387.1 hypothetical protein BV97_00138 [Novosphingobium resinovorum]
MAQLPAKTSQRVSQDIVRAARRQRAARIYNARKEQWRFRMRRLRRAFLAMAGIYIAGLVAALVLGGVSFTAGLLTFLLGVAVFVVLSIFPATPRTHVEDLNAASLPELAGSTELWLEGKRKALPNAAVDAVDMIGVRLEQLAPQLAMLDERGPAAREVRKLLTEHLPEMVNSYTRIPAQLRGKTGSGGTSPSEQLVDGLCVIADQIEAMSEDLSRNDVDALATRGRFLEVKYLDKE